MSIAKDNKSVSTENATQKVAMIPAQPALHLKHARLEPVKKMHVMANPVLQDDSVAKENASTPALASPAKITKPVWMVPVSQTHALGSNATPEKSVSKAHAKKNGATPVASVNSIECVTPSQTNVQMTLAKTSNAPTANKSVNAVSARTHRSVSSIKTAQVTNFASTKNVFHHSAMQPTKSAAQTKFATMVNVQATPVKG
jgi:hypothetical protein